MEFSTLLFVLGVSYAFGCDYAKYSPQHTMCVDQIWASWRVVSKISDDRLNEYKSTVQFSMSAEVTKGCDLMGQGFNDNDIKVILDAHNKARSEVAMGNYAGQPPAANMKQMVWDDELATIAQHLANQCVFNHDKNKNRRSHKYERVGQNLFLKESTAPLNDFNVADAVTTWLKEVKNMNNNFVRAFPIVQPPPDKAIGHYTQLVWAHTAAVGCGMAYYKEDIWYTKLLACNYGPSGNIRTMKLYEVGEACSKCPSGCSDEYIGLCQ